MPQEQVVDESTATDVTLPSEKSFEELLVDNMREYGGGLSDDDLEQDFVEEGEGDADSTNEGNADDEVTDNQRNSGRGRRPGIDKILTHLDESLPGARDVVSGMQSETNRVINELGTVKSQMVDIMAELRDVRRGGESAETQKEEAPDEFEPNEDQLRLIERSAEKLGFVRKSEVAAEKAQADEQNYVDEAMKEGVRLYGNSFGHLDDEGNTVLNPDLREKLRPVRDRLTDRGFTPLDLAVLAGAITPEQAAQQREVDAGQERGESRRRPRSDGNANVANTSVGGIRSAPDLRSGNNGDDPDTVFNRAWTQGRRRLSTTRR